MIASDSTTGRSRDEPRQHSPRLADWCEMPDFTTSPTGEGLARRIALLVWHCSNPYDAAIR